MDALALATLENLQLQIVALEKQLALREKDFWALDKAFGDWIKKLEASSVPFEVVEGVCEHRKTKPTEPAYCEKNYELCTKQTCTLFNKKGA
jgi:hypothetical protein